MPGIFSPFKEMSDKVHEIRKSGHIFFLLNAFLGAYNRRTDVIERAGGNNSQVLTAINSLNRKVDEFMATQEERLQVIFGALTEVKGGINTLSQQLADLKITNPAIEDEIVAIEGTVAEIRDSLPGAEPAPAPEEPV